MEAKFEVALRAQEIIDTLKEVLGGMVVLVDQQEKKIHTARSAAGWFSFRDARLVLPRHRCYAEASINDRWTLLVMAHKGRTLHPNAELLLDWAALKLAVYLADFSNDLPYPPAGGGGGPSGSAEIGIPVWWARRAGN